MHAAEFTHKQLAKLLSLILGILVFAAAMIASAPSAYAQDDEFASVAHNLTTQDESAQNYAVYNSADTNYNNEPTLTFYYGTPTGTAGTDYYVGYDTATQPYTSYSQTPWNDKRDSIKHIVFDSSAQGHLQPNYTAHWFSNFSNLKDVTGLGCLDTSIVADMNRMFYSCSALTSLDLSVLDTSNVKNMERLLYDCKNLSSLTLGGSFTTANVTNMNEMFSNCSSLTELDATQINTEKATTMSSMFSGCSTLASLDLTGFNTSNVTDMTAMFSGCTNLATLTFGDNFSTSKIDSMYAMFNACEKLETLTWPDSIDTSNVTSMKQMFHACKSLTDPGLGNFNTENVTTFQQMFDVCTSLETLNLSSFSTAKADSLYYMFQGCTKLKSVTFGNAFDVAKVTTMNSMFWGCTSLESLDLSKWNTSNVQIMTSAFQDCTALESLDLSNWDFSHTYIMNNMLAGCTSLNDVKLGSFAPGASLSGSGSCDMAGFFKGCTSFTGLSLTSWNTSKVDEMTNMFNGCTALESLDLSTFDTSNVSSFQNMFSGCTALESVTLGENFNCKGKDIYLSSYWATLPTPSINETYNGLWWKGSGTTSYKPNSEAMWSLTGSDIAGTWTWSTGIAVVATCSPSAGGTVSVSPQNTGEAGDTVTLTATPVAGYEFSGWTLTSGDNTGTLASATANPTTFTLGAANGTVKATFTERAYEYTIGNLSATAFTYNGSEQVPTVAVTDSSSSATLTAGTDYTVTYWQGDTQVTSPANAGTYTLRVTGAGNYASMAQADAGTFTIGKAASTVKLAAQTKTYTGKALAYSGTVTKTGSTGAVSYKYYSDAACTKTATPKAAGTYYVKATVAADANYNAATSAAATFTIGKAASTIKLAAQTKTYAGKALAYSGTVTKTGSTGAVSYKYYSDAACTKTATPKAAGTYYVKATVAADANYNAATSAAAKLTVNRASQTISAKNCSASFKGKKSGNTKVLAAKKTIKLKSKAKVTAKTTVCYAKANKAGGVKIVVNANTGKVTLKKGLKAGTYKVKVKLTAAKSKNYKAAKAKTITLTVKVK